MKKLTLLLLFIPLVSFGQVYNYSNGRRIRVEIEKPEKTRREIQNEETAARNREIAKERRAINRERTDYEYYNSASKKYEVKDYKGAINDLTEFISKYPKDPDGWNKRGNYKTWLDDLSGACYDWMRGAEYGSQQAQASLLKNCNSDGTVKIIPKIKSWEDWALKATEEYESEDIDNAIISISMAIKLYQPSDDFLIEHLYSFSALLKLHVSGLGEQDLEGALSDIKMALSINPQGTYFDTDITFIKIFNKIKEHISASESKVNKEKAIAKLKELKELLELEVITQKDYDKEKAILTPIILAPAIKIEKLSEN